MAMKKRGLTAASALALQVSAGDWRRDHIGIKWKMDGQFIQKHLTGIEPLTGSNYGNWKMQVEIVLGCLDYDYVLTEDKPEEPDESSSQSEKKSHAKWVKANKLAMLIIRASVDQTIRGGIPACETAKELLETIKKQFEGSVRARQYNYLVKLINLKYDGSGDVRQHILKVSQLIIRLRELGLQLEDDLMVHFAVASLPSKFDTFKVNYSSQD
ncbi:uncharacterized protein LOC109826810 [Asparagus officinalis]|uniref:uncharacterized protein LOC109826810 n=1 Tax=Asparagus officinalis TaxID=4686 RepID=UPI00098E022E|nr:uncharacterized protein LOC109826810 [Asparagus officinalis]